VNEIGRILAILVSGIIVRARASCFTGLPFSSSCWAGSNLHAAHS
jgi:hypothetical protein